MNLSNTGRVMLWNFCRRGIEKKEKLVTRRMADDRQVFLVSNSAVFR